MSRSSSQFAAALVLAIVSLTLVSCGGGSSSTTTTTTTGIPSTIVVNPSAATIGVAQQFTFSATIKDSSGAAVTNFPVTWVSSNSNVAGVDGSGIATGIAAGTAQITAVVPQSSTANLTSSPATLTVTAVVASVTISPTTATTTVGGTVQFSAVAKDKNGNPITGVPIAWFSSFANVATISNTGLATGVSKGTVTIVATANNVQSPPATLTVN